MIVQFMLVATWKGEELGAAGCGVQRTEAASMHVKQNCERQSNHPASFKLEQSGSQLNEQPPSHPAAEPLLTEHPSSKPPHTAPIRPRTAC